MPWSWLLWWGWRVPLTVGIGRDRAQSSIDKAVRRRYRQKTTRAANVIDVEKSRPDSFDAQVGVSHYVAEVATRLQDRLAEVASDVDRYLQEQIPDLRRDSRILEMLGPSIEGNVDTMLRLRYDIAVERVEAPTADTGVCRRLARMASRSTRWCAPIGSASAG